MDATTFEKIAGWAEGRLVADEPADTVSVVCTDTRALKAGDFFVALRGENFDAHTFVAEAAKRGAAGAMVQEIPANLPPDFAVVLVPDTLPEQLAYDLGDPSDLFHTAGKRVNPLVQRDRQFCILNQRSGEPSP